MKNRIERRGNRYQEVDGQRGPVFITVPPHLL